ncbi:MAG TPA: hypothetical protein VNU64_23820 [Burkholderiales bacterium]|nr:hypothetical protein [Burkholderiales bacterium]
MTPIGVGRQTWKRTPFADVAALARRAEVEVRALRLARIAELAERHLARIDAFGEAELRKLVGRPHFTAWVGPQIWTRAQQRVLEAHPQPPRADFAVRNALQMPAERAADGGEDLFDAVEADAADQMHIHQSAALAGTGGCVPLIWMR